MRNTIAQHDPPRAIASLTAGSVRHVDDLVTLRSSSGQLARRDGPGLIGQNPPAPPRRILGIAQPGKEQRTHRNPRRVEKPGASAHASYDTGAMTRDEIENALIAIVQKEKNVPVDKLTPATALADAGIDSLDSLTILFAIEEQFRISIPDDQARSITTFGDMVDMVQRLTT